MNPTIVTDISLRDQFLRVRAHTQFLSDPLEIEDFVVQPVMDVSPLKWHLGHTTWFFETFVLVQYYKGYKLYHPKYPVIFNSYYIAAGDRWSRENRGQLTRPTVKEVMAYREHVDKHMQELLEVEIGNEEMQRVVVLGLNHEQQHQELFLYDIKRILGDNPLSPVYRPAIESAISNRRGEWLVVKDGLYSIGYQGNDFHFDNEEGVHKVYLHDFEISSKLVTNGEFIAFIEDAGYSSHQHWLSEAWDWVNENSISAPRYWQQIEGEWWHYTLAGLEKVRPEDPLCHVSYYEADAFAKWSGARLPTEQEWEVACKTYAGSEPESQANFVENGAFRTLQTNSYDFYGNVWEWTSSPYTAYPYYNPPEGALGEYNGKFMVNQMVLRGGSFGTPSNHIRPTYRNFFHPHLRWLFAGVRLARHI